MQRLIKKILVPVDGSESSKKALEMGIALAKASGGSLTILEVVEEFGPLPGYYEKAPEGKDRVKWISEQRFEKIHSILDESPEIKWDRLVLEGYPADTIVETAAKGKYDMIVIGSRGLSAVGRFLVGSVSDRIVHHAPCSVTVVR
ncbi:universal stress protein [Leptospira stimsonii]|uniref:Universal stress protein n=1 Tax=Leptospira stimsonii TaxID=2202203 RepID=A0A4V3JVK3_9LEPT|nr:universal stress protein [Leptospira stimsonii]RHX83128.1 universal stress protein UspA [Leptospira stimsonii]RHX84688.1 universal stress protein UspA [Leptospira stimsonii]TGK23349.1 universal stress protein [Leptospira stimsonii]TGM20990.1 universal stress protein [Leptospira stimsonii]